MKNPANSPGLILWIKDGKVIVGGANIVAQIKTVSKELAQR